MSQEDMMMLLLAFAFGLIGTIVLIVVRIIENIKSKKHKDA